jgi:hypothetical protein
MAVHWQEKEYLTARCKIEPYCGLFVFYTLSRIISLLYACAYNVAIIRYGA